MPVRPTRLTRLLPATAVGAAAALAAATLGVVPTAGPAAAATAPATFSVTSFDGTRIDGNFFTADGLPSGGKAPTVLVGPGWSTLALTDPSTPTSTAGGQVGIAPLLAAGYNVITWDPRGFGTSQGQAEVDSPAFEGRDVSAIIDWLATQPQAQLDAPGDPDVGMAGGSYGGGVQLVAASRDHRIDAIAPDIAWNSLETSLDTNDTARSGWLTLLNYGAQAAGQRNDPRIQKFFADADSDFAVPRRDQKYLASRGPGQLVSKITAPTLLLQGTVDSLFPLREAVTNYRLLAKAGTPVRMVWFCGGHGVCLFDQGDTSVIESATLTWFATYLKHEDIATGPGFQWVDQRGRTHQSAAYPPAGQSRSVVGARNDRTLSLVDAGGSGPYAGPLPPGVPDADRLILPSRATNAVDVPVSFHRHGRVTGAAKLSLTYRGTAPRADARVLAQFVDPATGLVLGSQLTPIPVTLDGRKHHVTLPLEIVALGVRSRQSITLQLVAQSSLLDTHPQGGSIRFASIRVGVPVSG